MPIKDILFPMISYPIPTAADSVEKAVGLAASLGAHLTGLTFELDIRSPVGLYAHPADVSGILAAERAKSTANARDLVAAFDDVADRRGIMREHTIEHCPPIEVAHLLVAHARLRDLSVFPLKAADHGQRSLVETSRAISWRQVGTWPMPPFEIIARKFASNPEALAFAMLDPHPRMNVTLARSARHRSLYQHASKMIVAWRVRGRGADDAARKRQPI